jgi:hypothetical protein
MELPDLGNNEAGRRGFVNLAAERKHLSDSVRTLIQRKDSGTVW